MKKLFLLGFLSAGALMASAQVQIGTTTYDLQSNGSSGNRIYKHSDGTISVVWTEQCTVSGGTWPDRGIGYNYYDGTNWIHGADGTCDETGSQFGIADVRVGWPEVTGFPSGKEFVVSHSPLKATSRPQKGTGGMAAWSTTADIPNLGEGDTWPRMVSSGTTAHMVASGNAVNVNGVLAGIAYYRSTDEGATWSEVALPGMDGSSFNDIGGDNYAIHANNNVVAITAGSFDSDWVMWKSNDAGLTWEKFIIRKFDPTDVTVQDQDSLYLSNDGYHAVVVDGSGRVHAFSGAFGITITADASMANGYTSEFIIPQTEGLWYWNDAMPQNDSYIAIVEEREDIHSDPATGDWIGNGTYVTPALINSYQGSQTGQPNAAVDAAGNVYVVYSGIVEGTSNTGDSTGQSFRDLYIMRSTDGGMSWSCPVNLALELDGSRTDFEEDVFPSVHHMIGSDNLLHLTWQADDEPGLHVRIDLDPETPNNIMYRAVDVSSINFPTICTVSAEEAVDYVNKVAAFPNPTTGTATIQVDLKKAANVQVRVTNLLGQEVQTISARQFQAGVNNITVDLSAQSSGVYLYSIISDDFTVTNRLVKE